MGKTDKGVLIFDEWFEAMTCLSTKDFKALIYAMYRLQRFDEEPPVFKGKAALLGRMIFPYIKRRTESAKSGKKGAAIRHPAYGINPYLDEILEKRAKSTADDDAASDDDS
jgi:hypothetical protein